MALDHVGLNHLTWERAALVDGADVLPGLIAAHGEQIAAAHGYAAGALWMISGLSRRTTCTISTSMTPRWREQRDQPTRAEQVAAIERELLEMYADPALDRKPELLTHRGGAFYSEAAVALLASLVTDARDRAGAERAQRRHLPVPATTTR